MNRNEIAEKTISIFRKVFGDHISIDEQTSANDIERWDSLNHILLIQELEKAFSFDFNLFEIIEIRDVGTMVDYIYSKKRK